MSFVKIKSEKRLTAPTVTDNYVIDDRVYTIDGWLKMIYVISNSIFNGRK